MVSEAEVRAFLRGSLPPPSERFQTTEAEVRSFLSESSPAAPEVETVTTSGDERDLTPRQSDLLRQALGEAERPRQPATTPASPTETRREGAPDLSALTPIARPTVPESDISDQDAYARTLSTGQRLQNAANRFAQSVAGIPASALQGVSVLAKELDELTGTDEFAGRSAGELKTARIARRIREWAEGQFPDDPELRGAFLEDVLPSALGSGVSFLGGAGVTRALGGSSAAFAGGTGALAEAGSVYEEALAHGASEEEARRAAESALPLGALEAIPAERQLGRYLDALRSGRGGRVLRDVAVGAVEETAQESVQQVGENVIARRSFDPDRELLEDVGPAAGAAAITGGVLSGGASTVGSLAGRVRGSRGSEDVSTEERPSIRRRLADAIDPSRAQELEEAFRDPMTDLPNPAAFERARERLDADPDQHVASLDVSNLKVLNDTPGVGREVADRRLAEVAQVLREEAEARGIDARDVFRAGGDEFAVWGTDPDALGEVVEATKERVEPIEVGEFTSHLRGAVGPTWLEAEAATQDQKAEEEGPRFRDAKGGRIRERAGRAVAAAGLATEEDVRAFLEEGEASGGDPGVEPGEGPSTPLPEGVEVRPGGPGSYTVVGPDGREIGMLEYVREGDDLRVEDVHIWDPNFQRKGIGTHLYEQMLSDNPGATLSRGSLTEEGEAFRDAFDRSHPERVSGEQPSPLTADFDAQSAARLAQQSQRRGPPLQASETLPEAGPFSMEAREGDAPKPSEIARDLIGAVDLKMAEGKLGRGVFRKALGVYKPRAEVIRVQEASDIATLAHEVGHHLQKAFFPGSYARGRLLNDPLDVHIQGAAGAELRELAVGISDESLKEGWAEYWRRFIDNPSSLPRSAPNLDAWVRERLDEMPVIREALEKTRDDWQLFRDASPQARVRAKISTSDQPKHLDIKAGWSRFRTNIIDEFEPIRGVVAFLEERGVGPESIDEHAEQLARLVKGSTGTADHFLERGALDFNTLERTGPALKEVLAPVEDRLDDFRDYMVARRAQELHERDVRTGVRKEDADWTVSRLEELYGEDFRPAFDGIQEYNTTLLEYLRDAGVFSQETIDAIQEKNRNYVPFYRVVEGGSGGALGLGFGHLFSPVKRIKGSGKDIIDPLESITKNTYLYTHLAAKQQVSQALASLAEKEGAGQWLEGVMKPIQPVKLSLKEIENQLSELAGEDAVADLVETMVENGREDPLNEMLMVFRPGDYFRRPNTISVIQDGKRQWFEVAPELYDSLEGLNREQLGMLGRLFAKPARLLRAGATLAPEFQLRNPIRDQFMAGIQSEYGYVPFFDMGRGVFELMRKGDAYWQWKAAGGERAALLGLDRKSMKEKVEELMEAGGVSNVLQRPLDGMRAISALMEDASRMGEFLRAREQLGTSKEALQTAAGAAREVSIDFARHGAKLSGLRAAVAFWNARVQGYDRLARAVKKNPGRVMGTVFATITLPSLLEYWVNRDDEEYWEIPQWQRDLFWLWNVNGTWLRIPKPFELGLVFGTLPVRIVEWMDTQDPEGVSSFFRETLAGDMEGFLPIPTAISPLAENLVNYSLFLDRPIVSRSLENVEPRFQARESTSEVATQIGRWTNVSPLKIDNLLYGWTGGLGRLASQAIDAGTRAVQDAPPRPAGTLADVPGVRGVVARRPGFSSESIERLYRLRDEAQEQVSTLRHLEREGLQETYTEYLQDPERRRMRDMLPRLRSAGDELASLRGRRERIMRDTGMSPEEKRESIDELGQRATEIARRAIQRELPEGGSP